MRALRRVFTDAQLNELNPKSKMNIKPKEDISILIFPSSISISSDNKRGIL